jgi:carbamoyltransferase
MLTIGLSAIFHDSAVALVEDGRVVYAVEEERLSRVKSAPNAFPTRALEHVLTTHQLELGDIDAIGFFWEPGVDLSWLGRTARAGLLRRPLSTLQLAGMKSGVELSLRGRLAFELRRFAGDRRRALPPVRFFPHHHCHAAMAYACAPFERAAVLVADGIGGETCTSAYEASPAGLRFLHAVDLPHSLGLLYAAITQYLGFQFNSDEWKVMGLAPYGARDAAFDRFFAGLVHLLPDGGYAIDRRFTPGWQRNPFTFGPLLSEETSRYLGPPRRPDEEITDRHRAIARALQVRVEQVIFHVLRDLHQRTGATDLCFGGGVALNCVANGKIVAETPFRRVHVPFGPGDAGAALGAGLLAQGWPRCDTLRSPYLGPAHNEAELERELVRCTLPSRRVPDLASQTAKLLARGHIVGWFQGRMELGPRALGHRSILADPRRAEMKDRINAAVKYREGFRPFAPAVLAERTGDFFDAGVASPYMSFALKVNRPDIPAVTHVDGTGRLQTVERALSPAFHALISAFGAETGVPVVLNTSFNVKGEPIVCTPADAIRCFFSTGLDHLVLGPFLLSKPVHEQVGLGLVESPPGSTRSLGGDLPAGLADAR